MHDEEETLRMRFGQLPKHVSLVPARSDISTLSLFPVMDYCLTVRGTVGLEAACRGIPVLTGGTGRYDRKGFTVDSATPRQYLERIARLQDISPSVAGASRVGRAFCLCSFPASASPAVEHRRGVR